MYHLISLQNHTILLSQYLQRLEQEKHVLRRKLSAAESESDIRAQELEADYNDLKSKMSLQVSGP